MIEMNQPTTAEQKIQAAIQSLSDGDHGAHFEPDVIEAAQEILAESPSKFARIRSQIKSAGGSNAQIAEWSKAIRGSDDSVYDETIADELIELARADCELFHDPDRKPYATINQGTHEETWPIYSKGFGEWLSMRLYFDSGRAPSDHALKTAQNTLSGAAKFDGEEREVYLRCAPHENGYVIDLANDRWQVVNVQPSGWQVLDQSPVKFWRSDSMRPLPIPLQDGDIGQLWNLINIPKDDRPLVLAWILECWRPDTPFVVLELVGEQGSAKSTTHDYLRQLIDPNKTNLRSAPRGVEDIQVAAVNSWLSSFNNLSRLSPDMQDALCCLATGGGFSKRALYTDADEHSENIKRPVAINGISTLVTAPDLLDRAITIQLPRIDTYIEEQEIHAEFERQKPAIFGALLGLFSQTLQRLTQVTLTNPPRMVDYTKLGEAMNVAMGNQVSFSETYKEKRRDAVVVLIDSSPVGGVLVEFMGSRGNQPYGGTVGQLFKRLSEYKAKHRQEFDNEAWPRSTRGFSDVLKRLSPALQVFGYDVQYDHVRRMDGYHVNIAYIPDLASKESGNNVHNVHDVHSHEHYEHHEHENREVSTPEKCIPLQNERTQSEFSA